MQLPYFLNSYKPGKIMNHVCRTTQIWQEPKSTNKWNKSAPKTLTQIQTKPTKSLSFSCIPPKAAVPPWDNSRWATELLKYLLNALKILFYLFHFNYFYTFCMFSSFNSCNKNNAGQRCFRQLALTEKPAKIV